mgnify:FL=1
MKKLFVFLACGVAAIALSSCTKSAWERSYSHKSYVKVGDLKWATKNVGATKDNPYGELFTYEQALKACPDGWRLPTSDELEQLSQFYSVPVSYDGMNGMWFSGSTPYKEGVDAVFLPMAGHDNGEGKESIGSYGGYWSSTAWSSCYCHSGCAGHLSIYGSNVDNDVYCRSNRFSVRCLKN